MTPFNLRLLKYAGSHPLNISFLFILSFFTVCGSLPVRAQETMIVRDPQAYQRFTEARQWFGEEQFKLAYPIFRELEKETTAAMAISQQLYLEELRFYNLACELMQDNPAAAAAAMAFMQSTAGTVLKGQLGYYLGSYQFRKGAYAEAIEAFDQASVGNLNNRQVAIMQFQHGYSLFTRKEFTRAKPLLNSVRQSEESPYYVDANYYYGLLAFNDKQYRDAIGAFRIARKDPKYAPLVPYYTAAINYSLGEKDQAIQEAEEALAKGGGSFRTELLQLLGHAWFEKGQYGKARDYLQQYVNAAGKVKREDLYELAYCYYVEKQYTKAIEQFKPLAGGDDSLSQHAMYLLGDAYLKTGQKANARNAFLFCSTNSSNPVYREISLFHYGKLSYELGYDNEALSALKQYADGYPKGRYRDEARDLLVAVLANTSNYKEALELYDALPTKSEVARKQYPIIAYNRAQELWNDRNVAEAEKLLRQAMAAPFNAPVKSLAHFWLGEIAFGKNQYAEAVQQMEEYLEQPRNAGEANPNNARYTLGYSLLRLEQYKQAAAVFQQIAGAKFAAAQQETDVTLRLADCYYMQKDFGRALPLYSQVAARRAYGA
nr:tetratricopeptide repeat protein [Chitinophagaceae bacterium]